MTQALWSTTASGSPSPYAPTPQQLRAQTLVREGIIPVHTSLSAQLEGSLDDYRLLAAARAVLNRHSATLGHRDHARRACISLATTGTNRHVLTIAAPTEQVDSVGIVRILVALARELADASKAKDVAAPQAAEIAAYFRALLTDTDTSDGAAFWRESRPDRCATRALADSLGQFGTCPRWGAERVNFTSGQASRLLQLPTWRLEAVLLSAWRLVLQDWAPHEDGFIGIYRPGIARDMPTAVGRLGRYVPLLLNVPPGACEDLVEATQQELAEAERWVDFFTWPRSYTGGFCAGFSHDDLSTPLRLGCAEVISIDIDTAGEQLDIELRSWRLAGSLDVAVRVRTPTKHSNLGVVIAHRLPDALAAVLEPSDALVHSKRARMNGASKLIDPSDALSRIEANAKATPGALAALDSDYRLTYEELLGWSRIIAEELICHGVSRRSRVAICMDRKPSMISALLGVWSCGATAVLLDPQHPSERHGAILLDASPAAIVMDEDAIAAAHAHSALPLIAIKGRSPDRLVPLASERRALSRDEVAYMIYTSGSTGKPKGVEVTHASLANYLCWAVDRYVIPGGNGSLAHSSVAVDLTLTSLLVPLWAGQPVHMLASNDPEALVAKLRECRGLSFLKMTPSGLSLLSQMLSGSEIAAATHHLILGGEQLTQATLSALRQGSRKVIVTNEYGPTETTVASTALTFSLDDDIPDPVPIGTPLWNTSIEICYEDGYPAPFGAIGEIVIGGAGVARGYWRRHEETRAHFAIAPSGAIRYQTGDLGRLWEDGTFEYHGRRDTQIKLHGYRVEPEEAATVLRSSPLVAEAAVVAVTSGNGGKTFLSAFVVPAHGRLPTESELNDLATRQLPWYARPDRLEFLDRLPLTSGGKLDRAALIHRSEQDAGATNQVEEALGPAEILATAWKCVLGLSPAPTSNFFAAGGDSILALHLVAEARRQGLDLSVRDIFVHRTLLDIAASITRRSPSPKGTTDFTGEIELTPSQLVYLARRPLDPNSFALRWIASSPNRLDVKRLAASFAAVRRRHAALRCRFPLGNSWCARVEPPDFAEVEPRVIDLSQVAQERWNVTLEHELQIMEGRLDISTGMTVLLAVINTDSEHPHSVAWVAHHFVCDLISLQLATHELWTAYSDPSGYADLTDDGNYVAWVRSNGRRQNPHATLPTASGQSCRFTQLIDSDTAALLGALASDGHQRTLLTMLASALLRTLDTGDDSTPLVCVELHGRDTADLSMHAAPADTIGWLTEFRIVSPTVAAMRSDQALIGAVRATLENAHPSEEQLPEYAVNYLGEIANRGPLDALGLLTDDDPPARTPLFPLELLCWSTGTRFQFAWRYDSSCFSRASVELLAGHFVQVLKGLVNGQTPLFNKTIPSDLSHTDYNRIIESFE